MSAAVGALLFGWFAIAPIAGHRSGWMSIAHTLVTAALLLLLVPRLSAARRVALRGVGVATLLALVSLGLALRFAPERMPRSDMAWTALVGVQHALLFLALLFLVPGPGEDGASTRRWWTALLVALVAGQALVVIFGPVPEGEVPRPEGTLGNPNTLGALVGAAALALAGFAGFRRAALAALAPVGIFVLATRSRGAVAALGLVLLVLVVRQGRWRLLGALALLAALLVVVPNPLRTRVAAMRPHDAFSRPFLWGAALPSIAEHPLGIGPGMNKYVFPAHAFDPERPWLVHQRHTVGLTHNVLLTLTLEWGWLAGAAALIAALCAGLRLAARGPPDPLRTGAALGAAVLFLECQVDGIEQNPVAFGVFLLLAATALARRPGPAWLVLPGRAVAGAALLVGLALPALALPRARALAAQSAAERAVAAFVAGAPDDPQALRALCERAERLAPAESRPPRLRFEYEDARLRRLVAGEPPAPADALAGTLEAALAALDRARAVHPADAALARQGARLCLFAGREVQRSDALRARYLRLMQDALALDPLDVDGHWDLAQEARKHGEHALAQRHLDALFAIEPDHAFAWYSMARLREFDGDLHGALHDYVRAEEAWLNCIVKAEAANPKTRSFYEKNLQKTDLAVVRARLVALREALYF